ncbi:unnamed protein product [Adineta steineri]|uniref:WW domain-containing protein n=1 Tax=Adineta steineri TaxID=433720 RepID=A0A814X7D4_9BILA|nr:unnamed protein product [Adineta steineri]
MSNKKSSSYIIDEDQSRTVMNSLFHGSNDQNKQLPKPYRERVLPASFYHPPRSNDQHVKNRPSLPSTSVCTKTNNYVHSRCVSDSATVSGEGIKNLRPTELPLPDGWVEGRAPDGQIYYIDNLTKTTTWTDPRPNHYAAFQSCCSILPLPDNYKQEYDSKGNTYFIDCKTNQISRNDPRPKYYHPLMTHRLDVPSTGSQGNLLTNTLEKILQQRHELQLRSTELLKMEAEIRQRINQYTNSNSQLLINQPITASSFNDPAFHKRQESADSGLGDAQYDMNQSFPEDLLLSDNFSFSVASDFNNLLTDADVSMQDPFLNSTLFDLQLNAVDPRKQPPQWPNVNKF